MLLLTILQRGILKYLEHSLITFGGMSPGAVAFRIFILLNLSNICCSENFGYELDSMRGNFILLLSIGSYSFEILANDSAILSACALGEN